MMKVLPLINRGFSDINPVDMGWEACAPGHSYGPHIRDYYLIHYVRSGRGVFCNSRGEFPVTGGQIFIIRPGETTTYTADLKNPWHYIWVGFTGRLAEKLEQLQSSVMPYPEDTFLKLTAAEEYNNTREEYLAGRILMILSHLLDIQDRPPSYTKQATNYILSNFMREITVEDVAKVVGLNRRYLGRIFKESTGMTVQDFLVQTRLCHGAEYLKRGESVSNAAALSGYSDVFNFSKMFKKHFGVSPQQYKSGR